MGIFRIGIVKSREPLDAGATGGKPSSPQPDVPGAVHRAEDGKVAGNADKGSIRSAVRMSR